MRSLVTLIRLGTFSFGYKMPPEHPEVSVKRLDVPCVFIDC